MKKKKKVKKLLKKLSKSMNNTRFLDSTFDYDIEKSYKLINKDTGNIVMENHRLKKIIKYIKDELKWETEIIRSKQEKEW